MDAGEGGGPFLIATLRQDSKEHAVQCVGARNRALTVRRPRPVANCRAAA